MSIVFVFLPVHTIYIVCYSVNEKNCKMDMINESVVSPLARR